MTDDRPLLTFDDYWSWDRCPAAYAALRDRPYGFARPSGDPALAHHVLRSHPSNKMMAIAADGYHANTWLSGTLFGIKHGVYDEPTLPPAKHGHWLHGQGLYEGENVVVSFDVAYGYPVGTAWEVVLFDTHPTPPDELRRWGLLQEAAWTETFFHALTGEPCSVRLIAPGYEHEEVLRVPSNDLDIWIEAFPALSRVRRVRPGPQCHETMRADRVDPTASHKTRLWTCPLREAGRCGPAGPSEDG